MDFKVLEEGKNKLRLLLKNERTTIPEILRKRIYELSDEEVIISGYRVPHPLYDEVEFYLETEKSDAREILIKALQKILEEIREFKVKYLQAISRL